ncbi:MAG: ABC transporter permease [Acidobacteria bacterium]|nr:ABC transporter permease [Acidobacteriota bacterium]
METFGLDLRYAARSLISLRGVALVAIATLALGIGATTTMFGVVDAELLRPPPFTDPDRLVIVSQTRTTPREGLAKLRWSYPNIQALQQAVGRVLSDPAGDQAGPKGPALQTTQDPRVQKDPPYASSPFETVASVTGANITIAGGDGAAEQIEGELVSPDYFRTLRISPVMGRVFSAEEDAVPGAPDLAILGDRVWHQRFHSDPEILGKTVRINDVALTIVGVLPPGFTGITGKGEIWIPRTMAPRLTYADYLVTPQHFISLVARFRQGVPLSQANAELDAGAARLADTVAPPGAPGATWGAIATPLGEARVDANVRRSVLLLLAAAICVLVIACVNVASLLLARARTRRREFAVRLALGASRQRIVRLLLTEGLLLALAAGVCGTIVAAWGVAFFARTAPGISPTARNDYAAVAAFAMPTLDVRVLLFALVSTVGTTLLFALVPALQASRPDLVQDLKADERGGQRHRALASLVVGEVAIAVLLVASAGLLIESFARMLDLRTGFSTDRVITFWIRPPSSRYPPESGPAILERVLTRVEQLPGVEAAAINRCVPFTGCARTVAFFPDRPAEKTAPPMVGRHYTSPDYFRALGIPLRAGRTLAESDRPGRPPVAVINETGARRFWPGENPIGKRVWFGATTGPFSDAAHAVEIVGVVGDVKYESVEQVDPSRADFYTSFRQFAYPDSIVIVKARASASALLPALRDAIAQVDASTPIFDVQSLDERIVGATSRPRFNATVVAAFAGTAMLLAAIGVYGVLSYTVSSRMRELGIRLALGADSRRLLALVLGQGVRLAGIGAAFGIAAALVAARLLQSVLVGVTATDARVLAIGATVMLAVAALAACLPARRAAAIDPNVVLRDQ